MSLQWNNVSLTIHSILFAPLAFEVNRQAPKKLGLTPTPSARSLKRRRCSFKGGKPTDLL